MCSTHSLRALCLLAVFANGLARAQDMASSVPAAPADLKSPSSGDDASLLDLDLDQLARTDVVVPALDTPVTTVSRRESTVGRSPAAVFVIDQQMIERSGARSIPEALRIAPGVHVARLDANKWAISIRGANHLYSNKLLVQIDGRAVYSPLFGGTFWDEQDVVLEDVERIEVIRGPGATVWGANAVNGVINIITKRAEDTQGGLVVSGGGDQEKVFNTFRYGGKAGDDLHWRVYGKHFARDDGFSPEGAHDAWNQGRGGFRADWTPTDSDLFTLQGDIYHGTSRGTGAVYSPSFPFFEVRRNEVPHNGGNLLSRWTRQLNEESSWSVQLYYDRRERSSDFLSLERDTYDLDCQYNFAVGAYQRITTGAGYRRSEDATWGTPGLTFDPASKEIDLYSAFVQDELELVEDRWFLTLGSKLEHNDFTGFEVQPSARVLFMPDERQSWWTAVSRAVRTPARTDADFIVRGPASFVPPMQYELRTQRNIQSEDLLAYELGYRAQPRDELSFDVALFYHDYDDVIEFMSAGTPFVSPAGLVLPLTNANTGEFRTFGAELSTRWQLRPRWHLLSTYTWLESTTSPQNLLFMQSAWTLNPCWEVDLNLRYADSIPALRIPSYITCDARLAWTPRERLEVSVVGQNLLDSHHPQFRDSFGTFEATEVRRGVYGMLTWWF